MYPSGYSLIRIYIAGHSLKESIFGKVLLSLAEYEYFGDSPCFSQNSVRLNCKKSVFNSNNSLSFQLNILAASDLGRETNKFEEFTVRFDAGGNRDYREAR